MSWHRSVSPIITLWPFPHPLLYSLRQRRWFPHILRRWDVASRLGRREVRQSCRGFGTAYICHVELGLLRIYPRGAQIPNRSRTREDVVFASAHPTFCHLLIMRVTFDYHEGCGFADSPMKPQTLLVDAPNCYFVTDENCYFVTISIYTFVVFCLLIVEVFISAYF